MEDKLPDQSEPRYPNVHVTLIGEDGNAHAIMARVKKELRQSGVSPQIIAQFIEEATSGNYDHLIQTAMKWVTCH